MATIRQIAKDLGVSISTVSAVINKRGYVRDKLRARIEKASREADYRPNQIARSLRLRETRNVALMVPDLSNFFYSRPMRGAEDYLAAADCRLPVVDSREVWKRQRDYLLSFSEKIADAQFHIAWFNAGSGASGVRRATMIITFPPSVTGA